MSSIIEFTSQKNYWFGVIRLGTNCNINSMRTLITDNNLKHKTKIIITRFEKSIQRTSRMVK